MSHRTPTVRCRPGSLQVLGADEWSVGSWSGISRGTWPIIQSVGAGVLQDVQPPTEPVDRVEQAAVIHVYVVELYRARRRVRWRFRNVIADLGRLVRVAHVVKAHAAGKKRPHHEILRHTTPRQRHNFVDIVGAESPAALAQFVA